MSLSHEHVGSKIPAKINTFMLTRAELLIHLCYEIPCNVDTNYLTVESGETLQAVYLDLNIIGKFDFLMLM